MLTGRRYRYLLKAPDLSQLAVGLLANLRRAKQSFVLFCRPKQIAPKPPRIFFFARLIFFLTPSFSALRIKTNINFRRRATHFTLKWQSTELRVERVERVNKANGNVDFRIAEKGPISEKDFSMIKTSIYSHLKKRACKSNICRIY